jgi:hypothetical protein
LVVVNRTSGQSDQDLSVGLERLRAHGMALTVFGGVAPDNMRHRLRAIDLGKVNDRLFFNVASLGLGIEVQRLHEGE